MSTYRKIAIALLSLVIWFSTITTSLADVNTNVVASSKQLQAPIQILAFVDSDDTETNPISKLYVDIQQAWKKPNVKDSLFAVCDAAIVPKGKCLNILKSEIASKRDSIIKNCYTPGTNGKLCLDLQLRQLGLEYKDFDKWIKELG
jgi:hypothetical protein